METSREKSDLRTILNDLASADSNTRALCLRILLVSPIADSSVLPLLEPLLSDTTPCLMSIPYTFCELRLLAAQALAAERVVLDNDLLVCLRETVRPISADELGLLAESAGVLDQGGIEGLLSAFTHLRERRQLPLFDYIGDPYALRQSLRYRSRPAKGEA